MSPYPSPAAGAEFLSGLPPVGLYFPRALSRALAVARLTNQGVIPMRKTNIAAITIGLAGFAGAAAAAPQSLLVASRGDVPLLCEAGECAADITTICLQRDRDMPRRGTVYDIVAEADAERPLRIVGLLADGGEVELAASAAPVSIAAERGHLAVKLSVPATVIDRVQAFAIDRARERTGGARAARPAWRRQPADGSRPRRSPRYATAPGRRGDRREPVANGRGRHPPRGGQRVAQASRHHVGGSPGGLAARGGKRPRAPRPNR